MKKEKGNRRTFLKSLLAGSAVAASVTAVGKPLKAGVEKISPSGDETLYRETDAFKQYYKSLRF